MPPTVRVEERLEAARGLRELVLRHRESIDADRRLPELILKAVADIGIFRSMVPATAGGEEWDWPTWLRVVEELSTVDGAVGWIAGVGGSVNAIFSGWVADDVGRALCADPIASIAGAGMPSGTARRTEGGYVLSGRWQFGSSSPMRAGSWRDMRWRGTRLVSGPICSSRRRTWRSSTPGRSAACAERGAMISPCAASSSLPTTP